MRSRKLWFMVIAVTALALMVAGVAETQDKKPGGFPGGKGGTFPGGKGGRGPFKGKDATRPGSEVTVDRILSFDKNKDGKVTKDELPERLQDLIAKGDSNKDGSLDKDEISKLVAQTVAQGPGGKGGGFPPKGGAFGGPKGKGGFGPGGPGGREARALDELRLSGATKEKADAVVKSHQENVKKLMDLARSDLLFKMKDVLSEQEYKTFKEALERQPGPPFAGGGPKQNDLERRLEQLQRDLEEVRRQIKR